MNPARRKSAGVLFFWGDVHEVSEPVAFRHYAGDKTTLIRDHNQQKRRVFNTRFEKFFPPDHVVACPFSLSRTKKDE